jgi:hypothetical protein
LNCSDEELSSKHVSNIHDGYTWEKEGVTVDMLYKAKIDKVRLPSEALPYFSLARIVGFTAGLDEAALSHGLFICYIGIYDKANS